MVSDLFLFPPTLGSIRLSLAHRLLLAGCWRMGREFPFMW